MRRTLILPDASLDVGKLLARLSEIQWSARRGVENEMQCCPACYGYRPDEIEPSDRDLYKITPEQEGHAEDCWLAAAIGKNKTQGRTGPR